MSSPFLEWRGWGGFLFLLFLVVFTGDSSSNPLGSLSEWQGLRCFLILLSLVVHTRDSSSVVPPSVGMTELGCFLFYFLSWYILRFLVEPFWGSLSEWQDLVDFFSFEFFPRPFGMALPIRHPEERSDVRIYSI